MFLVVVRYMQENKDRCRGREDNTFLFPICQSPLGALLPVVACGAVRHRRLMVFFDVLGNKGNRGQLLSILSASSAGTPIVFR